jgi:hypothetical protein
LGASTDLHSSYLDPLQLINFDFDADTGPTFDRDADSAFAFHSDKAMDPPSKNDEDTCGSGSATLDTDLFVAQYESRLDPNYD